MRDSVVLNEVLRARLSRRTRMKILRHYPGVNRLGVNDRQFWILNEGEPDGVPAYYCRHVVTRKCGYIAKEDCRRSGTHLRR